MSRGEYAKYSLAHALGRFKWEIDLMPAREYQGWIRYFDKRKTKNA